jgi:hypothetical protein
MDNRVKKIILDIDFWVKQPLTSAFYDDGVELLRLIDGVEKQIAQGEIGYWGNSLVAEELIAFIYNLTSSILDVSHDILDAKFWLSIDLTNTNDDRIWELENRLECGELELPELIEDLKSIINGVRNSNSF